MTPNQPYRPAGLIADALDDYVRRGLISSWECKVIGRYDRYLLRRGDGVTTFGDDREHAETNPALVEEFLRDGILPCFPPPRKTRTDKYAGCQNASVRAFVASRQPCPQEPIRRGRGGSCAAHWRRQDARHRFHAARRRVFRSLRRFWRRYDVKTWSKWLAPYAGRWPEWTGPTARAQRAAAQATPDATTAPVSTP